MARIAYNSYPRHIWIRRFLLNAQFDYSFNFAPAITNLASYFDGFEIAFVTPVPQGGVADTKLFHHFLFREQIFLCGTYHCRQDFVFAFAMALSRRSDKSPAVKDTIMPRPPLFTNEIISVMYGWIEWWVGYG